jgi:hypothetical protein
MVVSKKLMVPSESTPQELSNEWSCQYVPTILNFFGQVLCPALGDRSHHQSLKVNNPTYLHFNNANFKNTNEDIRQLLPTSAWFRFILPPNDSTPPIEQPLDVLERFECAEFRLIRSIDCAWAACICLLVAEENWNGNIWTKYLI